MTEEKIFLVKGILKHDKDLNEYYFDTPFHKRCLELTKEEIEHIIIELKSDNEDLYYKCYCKECQKIVKKLEGLK